MKIGGPQGFKSVPSGGTEKRKEQHDDDETRKNRKKGKPQRHFCFPQRAPAEEGTPPFGKITQYLNCQI